MYKTQNCDQDINLEHCEITRCYLDNVQRLSQMNLEQDEPLVDFDIILMCTYGLNQPE